MCLFVSACMCPGVGVGVCAFGGIYVCMWTVAVCMSGHVCVIWFVWVSMCVYLCLCVHALGAFPSVPVLVSVCVCLIVSFIGPAWSCC